MDFDLNKKEHVLLAFPVAFVLGLIGAILLEFGIGAIGIFFIIAAIAVFVATIIYLCEI